SINTVKSSLPGICKVLKIDKKREAFPYLFSHKATGPIGFSCGAVTEGLTAVIIGFQSKLPFILDLIHEDIIQPVASSQWILSLLCSFTEPGVGKGVTYEQFEITVAQLYIRLPALCI